MKTLKLSPWFLLLLAVASCQGQSETAADRTAAKDGVLVHITAGPDDPHRVLMGLQMALKMSTDKAVAVYLDIEAVRVCLKDSPNLALAPFVSSAEAFDTLVARGVIVMVCPGCLQAAGKQPEDLRAGLRVASKERFFDFTDGRILTIDY